MVWFNANTKNKGTLMPDMTQMTRDLKSKITVERERSLMISKIINQITPKRLSATLLILHVLIVYFYDEVPILQPYPKLYEDAIAVFFLGIFIIVWQIEISFKREEK